jgi:hypothetical protein
MKRSILYIVALAGIGLCAVPGFAQDNRLKGQIEVESSTGAGAPAATPGTPQQPAGPNGLAAPLPNPTHFGCGVLKCECYNKDDCKNMLRSSVCKAGSTCGSTYPCECAR